MRFFIPSLGIDPSDLAFLCFRRAARHQDIHGRTRESEETFFCVLLDTCAKFNVFVPPEGLDPSAKLIRESRDQFTPIWEISSHDVLAKGPHTIKTLSGSIDLERLFTFGRPNWAARLEIGF